MNTAAPLRLAHVHSRCQVIADDGYRAIAPTACVPLDLNVRQRVNDLTEKIITRVLADPLDLDAARSIGVALARLHCLRPASLTATLRVLAQQLIAGLPTEQAVTLYPRLTALGHSIHKIGPSHPKSIMPDSVGGTGANRQDRYPRKPAGNSATSRPYQSLTLKGRHSNTVMNLLCCHPICDALVTWPPYTWSYLFGGWSLSIRREPNCLALMAQATDSEPATSRLEGR